jgi:NAD(P)-dependent dehydrogenase (short-subunit alcohol dehydrogenase family)
MLMRFLLFFFLAHSNGLLVLTGANASLGPTPGMIGYGMAKAAVHHLVKSLSSEGSGLPAGSVVNAILPYVLFFFFLFFPLLPLFFLLILTIRSNVD